MMIMPDREKNSRSFIWLQKLDYIMIANQKALIQNTVQVMRGVSIVFYSCYGVLYVSYKVEWKCFVLWKEKLTNFCSPQALINKCFPCSPSIKRAMAKAMLVDRWMSFISSAVNNRLRISSCNGCAKNIWQPRSSTVILKTKKDKTHELFRFSTRKSDRAKTRAALLATQTLVDDNSTEQVVINCVTQTCSTNNTRPSVEAHWNIFQTIHNSFQRHLLL